MKKGVYYRGTYRYGVPVGADLEYADEVTLMRALEGRNLI